MKIKITSDDDLSLKETLKLQDVVVVIRTVFNDVNKYYPQAFLDEYFGLLVY